MVCGNNSLEISILKTKPFRVSKENLEIFIFGWVWWVRRTNTSTLNNFGGGQIVFYRGRQPARLHKWRFSQAGRMEFTDKKNSSRTQWPTEPRSAPRAESAAAGGYDPPLRCRDPPPRATTCPCTVMSRGLRAPPGSTAVTRARAAENLGPP